MKHKNFGEKSSNSTDSSKKRKSSTPQFAVCVSNNDYPSSLEIRKIYRVLPDTEAAERGLMRVVDESGADYLYPESYFVQISLPHSVERALSAV